MKTKKLKIIQIVLFCVLILITIGVITIYIAMSNKSSEVVVEPITEYQGHYCFVVDDLSDEFLNVVYDEISKQAEQEGIYVDKVGENLTGTYTLCEKLEMAIATNPKGIIIEAEDSAELRNLIKNAVSEDIIVVAIVTDAPGSARQSFIGPNYYDLGKAYGLRLRELDFIGRCDVAVLLNSNLPENNRNSIIQGIVETVNTTGRYYRVDTIIVDSGTTFSVEEAVRTLVLNDSYKYDAIVAIDPKTTTYAYQALVDYNHVGDVDIVGFYVSESVLNGIKNGNLNASVTLNPIEIGDNCVKAIKEYENYGYSSYYIPVSIETITAKNADDFVDEITIDE